MVVSWAAKGGAAAATWRALFFSLQSCCCCHCRCRCRCHCRHHLRFIWRKKYCGSWASCFVCRFYPNVLWGMPHTPRWSGLRVCVYVCVCGKVSPAHLSPSEAGDLRLTRVPPGRFNSGLLAVGADNFILVTCQRMSCE